MKTGNKPSVRRLALTGIEGQVAYTRTTATAWYVLPRQPWFFVDPNAQKQLKTATASQYAALAGRRLHLRGTDRPWNTKFWREAMIAYPTGTPLDCYEGDLHRTSTVLDRKHLSDRVDMLGVQLKDRRHPTAELDELGYTLAGPGFEAIPASPSEIEWLVRRSVSLGCPVGAPRPVLYRPPAAPDLPAEELGWTETDIAALAQGAERFQEHAFDPTVTIRYREDADIKERYLCVSTLSRVERFDLWEPWLAMLGRLPFHVETSVVVDVLTSEKALSKIERVKRKVDGQFKHYAEFPDVRRPLNLDIAGETVQLISHDLERGMEGEASRAEVWVHYATSGATPAEAVEKAKQVARLYAPKVEIEITSEQAALVDSFIPCEPHPTPTFMRPMSVRALARAVPTVDFGIGHHVGHYIGFSSFGNARLPVLLDTHHNQEVANAGSTIIMVGDLGTGKSSTGGSIIYGTVTSGEHTTVFDPGGALARFCRLWPDDSIHIDLMSAAAGTLSPYATTPDPLRANYDTVNEYEQAVASAAATRHTSMMTVCRLLLPAELQGESTYFALDEAVDAAGTHVSGSGMNVITALFAAQGSLADQSRRLAKVLHRVADTPAGRLLFAPATHTRLDEIGDPLLTVITAAGVALPSEQKPRERWTIEESLNATLVYQAAWLVHRSVHARPRSERKTTMTDENYVLRSDDAGKGMITDAAHMTRQLNQTAIWMSHGAGEFGADAAELLDIGFAGRIANRKRQQEVLNAFRLPLDVGYEEVLGSLRAEGEQPREMIAYIGRRHQKITVDLSHLPAEVREILNTTPGTRRQMATSVPIALAS